VNLMAAVIAFAVLAAAIWGVAELFKDEPLISNDPADVKAYCEGQVAERISPEHENYRGRVSDCTHVIETDGLIS
jgi:hypothetical protein